MDESTTLVAIVAASVPSLVVGMVGYFLRRTLEKLERSVDDVGKSVATHSTALAVLEQRLVALEQGRVVRLEADHGRLLGLVERLEERLAERVAERVASR